MEHYGDFEVFPKELKSLIFEKLDSRHLGRLLQLNKTFLQALDELGIWKHLCTYQWQLSPERAKIAGALAHKVNWKREYRILEDYSKRIFENQLIIRPADSSLAKTIDEDPNSLHYHLFTDANMDPKAIASQGKFKLYPLPHVNFCVAYYEVQIENFGPDEPIVGIGLALNKYVQALPGWGKDSYGLHSDDGCFFDQRLFGIQFTEPWHVGDTFGLGVNYATKEIFITRNGALLGTMATRVRNLMHMHATVGVKCFDNKCRVNFGQRPFEFDIVHYLQELDKDETIKTKWPFKLYSEIIGQFETQLLDGDDPEEVEQELIAASDYYEKSEQITDIEENEYTQLSVGERMLELIFQVVQFIESQITERGEISNALKVEELYSLLSYWRENLNLPINPDQPLPQLAEEVTSRLWNLLAINYAEGLPAKRDLRRAEGKTPTLKTKRTIRELFKIYDENATLMLYDTEIPHNHPLVRRLCQIEAPEWELPPVVTEQDWAQLAYYKACNMVTEEKTLKAEEILKRRKKYQEQCAGHFFAETYGPSSFANMSVHEPEKKEKDPKSEKREVSYTDSDKIAAQHYAMLMYKFVDADLPSNHHDNLKKLLWWHLAFEQTYDFKMSLDDYRDHCSNLGKEEVDYWTDEQSRWESIIRGTYGVLCDDEDDVLVMCVMVDVWEWFLEVCENMLGSNIDSSSNPPEDIIKVGLVQLAADLPKAFELFQNVKLEQKQQDAKRKKSVVVSKPWQKILTTASVAVAVGLATAATFWFFHKSWSKK